MAARLIRKLVSRFAYLNQFLHLNNHRQYLQFISLVTKPVLSIKSCPLLPADALVCRSLLFPIRFIYPNILAYYITVIDLRNENIFLTLNV